MKGAKLIGGPMDGQIIPLNHLPPELHFPTFKDVSTVYNEPEDPVKPMAYDYLTYKLYDDWPVKYVYETQT